MMLGDYDIHVDSDCTAAKDFMSVLDYFEGSQHIDFTAHFHCHTLDVHGTVGIENVHAQGHDLGISDHKLSAFVFSLP